MKAIVAGLLWLFAVNCLLAAGAATISQSTKSMNDLLLPELTRVLDAIKEHNRKIDEKTDTFVEAFIHYNFSKDRYVDDTPYYELKLEVERTYRLARVLEALSMLRERAAKSGRPSPNHGSRKEEQEFFQKLHPSLEKVVADARTSKLKIDQDTFERLATELKNACSSYALEIGLETTEEKDGEPGATDNPDDAQ